MRQSTSSLTAHSIVLWPFSQAPCLCERKVMLVSCLLTGWMGQVNERNTRFGWKVLIWILSFMRSVLIILYWRFVSNPCIIFGLQRYSYGIEELESGRILFAISRHFHISPFIRYSTIWSMFYPISHISPSIFPTMTIHISTKPTQFYKPAIQPWFV